MLGKPISKKVCHSEKGQERNRRKGQSTRKAQGTKWYKTQEGTMHEDLEISK